MGKVTICTSLFDLGRREENPYRKSVDHYLRLSELWMRTFEPLADSIIVFCDPELANRIPHAVPCSLEETVAWSRLDDIRAARDMHPFHHWNQAKDTPMYAAFQQAKIGLLKQASRISTTSHIAWIDIGIAEAVPLDGAKEAIEHVKSLKKVQLIELQKPQQITDWQVISHNISGGFISGPCDLVEETCISLASIWERMLHEAFTVPHDERLFEYCAYKCPDDFDNHRVPNMQEIFRSFKRKAGLCLNMIVKNESAIIARCLESVAPWISRYAILDTGSTDGTQELIGNFMQHRHIPGLVHQGTFENFSQARNDALTLARENVGSCSHILLCDADMQLVVEDPDFLQKLGDADALLVRQESGISYDNTRLLKANAIAKYVGPTHEFLSVHGRTGKLAGVKFIDHADGSSRPEKFERDKNLLLQALKENPKDARSMFYLAQTYKDMGAWLEAISCYQDRIEAGGWEEETWYSIYMQAKCQSEIAKTTTVKNVKETHEANMLQKALEAYEQRPLRTEPLYLLANYYREAGSPERSIVFARTGLGKPRPDDSLFVEDQVYRHGFYFELSIAGFYCKDQDTKEAARKACFQLTTDKSVPCWIRDTARKNSVHYAETAKKAFGARRVDRPKPAVDESYTAMNPSVCAHEGQIYEVVRSVNYVIEEDGRYTIRDEGNVIRTRNLFMLPSGKTLPIVDSVESSATRTDFCVQGYEDMRLFRMGQEWWASSTVRDRSPDGRCQIALLKMNVKSDHVVIEQCIVQQYGAERHQKNWMPFGEGSFLYSCQETEILVADERKQLRLSSKKEDSFFDLSTMRGSSQLISFGEGMLGIVHEAIDGAGKRQYLHRFMWIRNSSMKIEKISAPFVFDHVGIEFCCGMAAIGERILISYGCEDREARYVEACPGEISCFLQDNP